MKTTKIITPFIFVGLLASLTAFTPAPESKIYEQRAPLDSSSTRFPFDHSVQNSFVYRYKLDDKTLDLSQAKVDENFSYISIDEKSASLLTAEGKHEFSQLSEERFSHAYHLPTGVSENPSALKLDVMQYISPLVEVQEKHYAQIDHSANPSQAVIAQNSAYATGALCLPTLPTKQVTNPFFVAYKNLPKDLSLQKQPIVQRANAYNDIVQRQARKYGLSSSLILAIIHVESGFNPNAVSHMNAHGLMQIVVPTAGLDVHKYLNKSTTLRPDMLHNPDTNITYGTTYLHLLNTRHFDGIHNTLSREYCMIAAYNGGSRRVLELFGHGQAAFDAINKLSPNEVYRRIQLSFPSAETRNFITKVVSARNAYYAMK